MPPFVGRKRLSTSPDPYDKPSTKRAKLSDALDTTPFSSKARTFSLGSDSDSSLSDVDSEIFEDVKRITTSTQHSRVRPGSENRGAASEDDEDTEWEDAPAQTIAPTIAPLREIKDVKINLSKASEFDFEAARRAVGGKKGPSKREKQARINTHQMHIQFLMWHNAIRNSWISDKQVQDILVKQLPSQILAEIEKWRKASGLVAPENQSKSSSKDKKKKQGTKGDTRQPQRDWGRPSQHLDPGKADMSRGDPLIYLLKVLSAYWKKKFVITAPGLRKRGYSTKLILRQEVDSFKREKHNPAKHGECVPTLRDFRSVAASCQGSRDIGAQLFTAMLRGIGIEARMVASLQPAGYGWTKAEQMPPRGHETEADGKSQNRHDDRDGSSSEQNSKAKSKRPGAALSQSKIRASTSSNPITIGSDDGLDDNMIELSDESVEDVTPSLPKARNTKYDRDLTFPIYWTEAISPVTSKVVSVSPLVVESPVVTLPSESSIFEPRGAKAEKARQVMAYVVAHSLDGTAKDVTVRYLRKKIWPGRTKGFRLPVEKVPIFDKRGKIKRYDNYDWFKYVMMYYRRSDGLRTVADDIEDAADLVPAEPEKKEEALDTLQGLKASADFVLERFLRREEALKPGSQPVRTFLSGKGDSLKEEPVYSRADVERCLTAESWHKEGRRPKAGETPMKLVPVRAVTLTRKREAEEHQIRTGEKQMQGLYSWDQTEWIIPPPIVNGVIPKNSYGNIDCFVPSMVPTGAVHVPLKGTVRLCKRLEIDYAEAVTGFEFGNKMAVPVIIGVVIAVENERMLRDAWREWTDEQKRKENKKLESLVLDKWKKFLIGLRIRSRLHHEYGATDNNPNIQDGSTHEEPIHLDDEGPGGFLPEQDNNDFAGGFLLPDENEVGEAEDLVMDNIYGSQKNAIRDADSNTIRAMDTNFLSKPQSETTLTVKPSMMAHASDQPSYHLSLPPPVQNPRHDDDHDSVDTTSSPSGSIDYSPPLRSNRTSSRPPPRRSLRQKAQHAYHVDASSSGEESTPTLGPQAVRKASTQSRRGKPRKTSDGGADTIPKGQSRSVNAGVTSPYFR